MNFYLLSQDLKNNTNKLVFCSEIQIWLVAISAAFFLLSFRLVIPIDFVEGLDKKNSSCLPSFRLHRYSSHCIMYLVNQL